MVHTDDFSLRRVWLGRGRKRRDQVVEDGTEISRTTTDVQHPRTRIKIGKEVFYSICVLRMRWNCMSGRNRFRKACTPYAALR